MYMRRSFTFMIILLVMLTSFASALAQDMMYSEAPMLAERVAAGELPPVEERLPSNPKVYSRS